MEPLTSLKTLSCAGATPFVGLRLTPMRITSITDTELTIQI
jgi:hypothetical protein